MTKQINYKFNTPNIEIWLKKINQILSEISDPYQTKNMNNRAKLYIRGANDAEHKNNPYVDDKSDEHQNELLLTSYAKIPKGNYYIKCFFRDKPIAVYNLFHNSKNEFVANGKMPIYLFEEDVVLSENKIDVTLKTTAQLLRLAIYDRLMQIEYNIKKYNSPAKWDLIEGTANAIFRFAENNPSNTLQHTYRIANRFVFIPKNNKTDNHKWNFDPEHNPKGSLTDCYSATFDKNLVTQLFNDINLTLGVGTEGSGMKNNFSEASDYVYQAKLKYPFKNELEIVDPSIRFENDPVTKVENSILYSIFPGAQKVFARMKSLLFANVSKFSENDKEIAGHEYSFNRSYNYLHKNPDLIGVRNDSNVNTSFNILAVFLEGPTEIRNNNKHYRFNQIFDVYKNDLNKKTYYKTEECKEFFLDSNKQDFSLASNYADCHIEISNEIANSKVNFNRTIMFDLPLNCLNKNFYTIKSQIDAGEIVKINNETEINFRTVLAQVAKCPCCDNSMEPSDTDKNIISVIKDSQIYWLCPVCNHFDDVTNQEFAKSIKDVTFRSFYYDEKKIALANNIEELRIEQYKIDSSNIVFNCEIVTKIDVARCIGYEGLKGMSLPVSDEITGNLNVIMKHPETNDVHMFDFKVDAIVPYGALKGKNNGMSIAFVKFINVIFKTKYTIPDQTNLEKFNSKFAKIEKEMTVNWTRKAYCFQTNKFETITSPVRFGIISFNVTEINAEYLKFRNINNPGKISPFELGYFDILGFKDLSNKIREFSVNSIDKNDNYQKLNSLLKAFKGNAEE